MFNFDLKENLAAAQAAGFSDSSIGDEGMSLEDTIEYLLEIIEEGRTGCMAEEFEHCELFGDYIEEEENTYEDLLVFMCDRHNFH